MIRSLFISIFLFFSLFSNCAQVEDTVPVNDAQSQIYAAAKFAADRCNTPIPSPPILVINAPVKRNLDLCTISITRTGCPFLGYPIACTLIYLDRDPGNIPWWANFNALSRQQIR